jgi:hypothetical protein
MISARYLLFAIVVAKVGWLTTTAFAQINSLALFNLRATDSEAVGPNTEIIKFINPTA